MHIFQKIENNLEDRNFNFAREFNSFFSYIDDLAFRYNAIVLYGAGTIAKFILSYIPTKVVLVVDNDKNKQQNGLSGFQVHSPEEITMFDFDIILITVLGREKSILNFLVNSMRITRESITFFSISNTNNYTEHEKEIKILNNQSKLKCDYNIAPYTINEDCKEINLVFFIGIGDYLYTTPVIEEIKNKYPKLIINAYVSKNLDIFNNPLVYKLLENNPCIDNVHYYNGKPNANWWQLYDFSSLRENIEDCKTIFPVVYDNNNPNCTHRVLEMYRTFSLDIPINIPKPQIYTQSFHCVDGDRINRLDKKVIILHLEGRSSQYIYSDYIELVDKLISFGYFVIFIGSSFEKDYSENTFYLLNIKKFSLDESISFIDSIQNEKFFIAINSVMFPISSALDIPMLALYIFRNSIETRQTYYDNMKVLTVDKAAYDFLPVNSSKLINEKDVEFFNGNTAHYPVKLILDSFLYFFK